MIKKFIFSFFILLLCSQAQAKIYIVIDEGAAKKFPIAVPRFVSASGGHSAYGDELTELVKKDLDIAGFFKVMDEKQFVQEDHDTDRIDFSKWKALEAQALVKGIVRGKEIEMRLFDTQTQELLVGKVYTVDKRDYNLAVHRFMDELMKAMTGTEGPFSSLITAACGKVGQRQIAVFGVDGTGMRYVTSGKTNNISPTWSPDGNTIAFTSFLRYYPEIFSTTLGGKGMKQLTTLKSTSITPAFSPDGGSIVFASAKGGDTELYKMGTGGGKLNRLTQVLNIDVSPTFTPDGGSIIFSSERAGNLHLFSMNSGGGSANRLTYTGYQNDQADVSADGQRIVFTSRDKGAFDVFLMNTDGSMIQRVTRDEGNNESPTWAPDSRYISFSRGNAGIFTMMDDGGNQRLIPNTGGCINPEWGPRLK